MCYEQIPRLWILLLANNNYKTFEEPESVVSCLFAGHKKTRLCRAYLFRKDIKRNKMLTTILQRPYPDIAVANGFTGVAMSL